MGLRIRLTIECKRAWRSLHIDVQKSLKTAIKKLSNGEIKGKELTEELAGYSSIKVGNHRAIYRFIENMLVVFDVGHRGKIYSKAILNKGDSLETI